MIFCVFFFSLSIVKNNYYERGHSGRAKSHSEGTLTRNTTSFVATFLYRKITDDRCSVRSDWLHVFSESCSKEKKKKKTPKTYMSTRVVLSTTSESSSSRSAFIFLLWWLSGLSQSCLHACLPWEKS